MDCGSVAPRDGHGAIQALIKPDQPRDAHRMLSLSPVSCFASRRPATTLLQPSTDSPRALGLLRLIRYLNHLFMERLLLSSVDRLRRNTPRKGMASRWPIAKKRKPGRC